MNKQIITKVQKRAADNRKTITNSMKERFLKKSCG